MTEVNMSTGGAIDHVTSTDDLVKAKNAAGTQDSENAQHTVAGIVGRVRESATAQLTNQKDRSVDALGSVAQAVRSTTNKLRDERHDTIASYLEHAANQMEDWTRRLKDKDIDELLTEVQRFGRRQPGVFIGAAFVLGVVGSRFLKSSRLEDGYEYGAPARMLPANGARTSGSDAPAVDDEASISYGASTVSDKSMSAQNRTTSRSSRSHRSGADMER